MEGQESDITPAAAWITSIESHTAPETAGDSSTEETEIRDALKLILPCVLEHEPIYSSIGSLFLSGSTYYHTLADHIVKNDPCTLDTVKDLAHRVRQQYKSWEEHHAEMNTISLKRSSCIFSQGDDVCCVCHEPLDSWRRVYRLRPESGDPKECGHLVHYRCVLRLSPRQDTEMFHCPMCRASLGKRVRPWLDMSRPEPMF